MPGVAFADPSGNRCANIGTPGPGGYGLPDECQKVDDPANPQQWVTIADVAVGSP
jgi:hypothetical protein